MSERPPAANDGQVAVRHAVPADAAALGALHVAVWRETYAGMMPDAVIAAQTVAARTATWTGILETLPTSGQTVLVAQREGALVAFAACGPQRDAALAQRGFDGEIMALYVLAAEQRQGLAHVLMRTLALALRKQGFGAVSLWVLQGNANARRFYERSGGQELGEKQERRDGEVLTETAYGWRDLGVLVAACADASRPG